FGVEKFIFVRNGIFVPARDFFPVVAQRNRQRELRADAIAVGADVPDDAERFVLADNLEDAVDDFRVRLHFSSPFPDWARSSSSMICKTRLPRTMESSKTNLSVGVYLSTTERATSPWIRARLSVSNCNPRFCWTGFPRILMKTTADFKSPE